MAEWRYDEHEGWTDLSAKECRQKYEEHLHERQQEKANARWLAAETEIECKYCGKTKIVHSKTLVEKQQCNACFYDELKCKEYIQWHHDWSWDEKMKACMIRFPSVERKYIASYITDVSLERLLSSLNKLIYDTEKLKDAIKEIWCKELREQP